MIWLWVPLAVGAVIYWWPEGDVSSPTPPAPAAQQELPSLPDTPLAPADWSQLKQAIKKAVARCAHSSPSLVSEVLPFREQLQVVPFREQPHPSPLLGQMDQLLHWLKAQGCVKEVRLPLAEAEGVAALQILPSLPAQVEVEIDFLTEDQGLQTWVLTLYLTSEERMQFAALRRVGRSTP